MTASCPKHRQMKQSVVWDDIHQLNFTVIQEECTLAETNSTYYNVKIHFPKV